MKKTKWIVTRGVRVLAGAGIQYLRRFWKKIRASETPEEKALREWSELLTADAGVYTGMFSSLKRVVEGKAKKPEKVLREWCARTSYKWPEGKAAQLCQEYLMPAAEAVLLCGWEQQVEIGQAEVPQLSGAQKTAHRERSVGAAPRSMGPARRRSHGPDWPASLRRPGSDVAAGSQSGLGEDAEREGAAGRDDRCV